jgi:hypothetical protein
MQSDDTVFVIMSQNPSTVFTISQIHHHSHCIHRILPQFRNLESNYLDLVAKNQPVAVLKQLFPPLSNPQTSLQNPKKSLL